VRIAGSGKRQGRSDYVRALRPHASAVINHQPYGNGNVFTAELFDFLLNALLEDYEVLFNQS